MLSTLLNRFRCEKYGADRFPHLTANVLEVRNLDCLKKAMNWVNTPILTGDHLHEFKYIEDLNDRRLRDAEVVGGACCNGDPKTLVEIGTSHGYTTALMAENAVNGTVYTVNIPPEEIAEGGINVTGAPSYEEIGSFCRAKGLGNICQIFANTARWEPDFGPIDVAFIDGCHDADFVYGDTVKILQRCRPGAIVMWHDFNPWLRNVYPWIQEVCSGVERLYREAIIKGKILCLQDSWVGLYRVPKN